MPLTDIVVIFFRLRRCWSVEELTTRDLFWAAPGEGKEINVCQCYHSIQAGQQHTFPGEQFRWLCCHLFPFLYLYVTVTLESFQSNPSLGLL